MIDFESAKAAKRVSKKKVKLEGERRERQDGGKLWNFGKITKIDIEPYTHKWLIEIQHGENRVEKGLSTINPEKANIACFPTKSYLYSEQYHIRLLNRVYN